MNNKVIEKIKKCLTLAADNAATPEEAVQAALMAQKLMLKNNVTICEVQQAEEEKEEIKINYEVVGAGKAWKYSLATIIADNFRCKTFSFGSNTIAFYGNETDSVACKEVFKFLFYYGDKKATSISCQYKATCGTSKGVYSSFTLGYLWGIKDKLDTQSKALMIIIPKEVEKSFEDFMQDVKKKKTNKDPFKNGINLKEYKNGYKYGQQAMGRRELA